MVWTLFRFTYSCSFIFGARIGTCVPSMQPITFGKPAIEKNRFFCSFAASCARNLIHPDCLRLRAPATRLIILPTVDLCILNASPSVSWKLPLAKKKRATRTWNKHDRGSFVGHLHCLLCHLFQSSRWLGIKTIISSVTFKKFKIEFGVTTFGCYNNQPSSLYF